MNQVSDLHSRYPLRHRDQRRQPRQELLPSATVGLKAEDGSIDLVVDLIDITEGGACLVIPASCDLNVNDRCELTMELVEGHYQRRSVSVRWRETSADVASIGVQFLIADDAPA